MDRPSSTIGILLSFLSGAVAWVTCVSSLSVSRADPRSHAGGMEPPAPVCVGRQHQSGVADLELSRCSDFGGD